MRGEKLIQTALKYLVPLHLICQFCKTALAYKLVREMDL